MASKLPSEATPPVINAVTPLAGMNKFGTCDMDENDKSSEQCVLLGSDYTNRDHSC